MPHLVAFSCALELGPSVGPDPHLSDAGGRQPVKLYAVLPPPPATARQNINLKKTGTKSRFERLTVKECQ